MMWFSWRTDGLPGLFAIFRGSCQPRHSVPVAHAPPAEDRRRFWGSGTCLARNHFRKSPLACEAEKREADGAPFRRIFLIATLQRSAPTCWKPGKPSSSLAWRWARRKMDFDWRRRSSYKNLLLIPPTLRAFGLPRRALPSRRGRGKRACRPSSFLAESSCRR